MSEESYFGRYLLSRGLVDEAGLSRALDHQAEANRRIGAYAVSVGLLNANQVEEIIEEQRRVDSPFGAIALDKGFLTPKQLDDLLFTHTVHSTHLGEAMLELGLLTPVQFDAILAEYNAMRDRRVMAIENVLAGMAEHDVLKAVLAALESAFYRFVGQTVRVLSVAQDLPDHTPFAEVCVRVILGRKGWVEAEHFLDENFALALASGFTGKPPEACREECLHRLADFFAIMERYLAADLTNLGYKVSESNVRVVRSEGPPKEEAPGVIMRAATNVGDFHLRIGVAKPRGRGGSSKAS